MKKRINASPTLSTHQEKKPLLERFWPTGVFAALGVAAAIGLNAGGYTSAPVKTEAVLQAPLAAPLPPEEAAALESTGAEDLIKQWEAAHPDGASEADEDALSVSEREVATYISRSYRVPMADAEQLTAWAVEIGAGFDVDPLLILAVAAIESSFNPKAKSGAGAEGLMQVMTRVHAEKFHAFGGRKAALEPYPSLVVGTSILSRLIARTGSVQKALKFYFGAANQPSDGGYSERVFKERSRMLVAAGGDSDKAVQLSRKKRTGPEFAKNRSGVKQLGFEEWTEVTGIVETKLAEEKGKVRQLQASSNALEKRSAAAAAQNLPEAERGEIRRN